MRFFLVLVFFVLVLAGLQAYQKTQQGHNVPADTQNTQIKKDLQQPEWNTTQQGTINLSRVRYDSEGLSIAGLVCAPRKLKDNTPLIMLEHGGFDTSTDPKRCAEYARLGYVIAQSAYRGQGGSEGKVEACQGEVQDSLALKQVVQERLKTRGVVHIGVSLGGCIALKAAAQQKDVKGVAILVTPMDFAQQIRILRATRPDALDRWYQIFGGTPEDAPEQYEKRQPLKEAALVDAPVLNLVAAQDPLIPYKQLCDLLVVRRKADRTVKVVHLARNGSASPPVQERYICEGEGKPALQLPAFRQEDVFVTYYNLYHTSTPHMWKTVQNFVFAVAPRP
ncbi:alpha/beta hydrolase family protein [Deinococcus roseus]|uniref:Xaa-Pro dipeptidyl-peptidase-like domain-containing protein n=1 Tax=Deinococcus roseus TaxID=392414 RepID=A0ABQ2D3P5_9DEIO|nr:alpha/beta fold hydrolase [Deinococcus roseus]GGJ41692.1 hypothetical protein GCM10008938_29670 [Deinococcus roseus]